ncbi:MAG TPA: hypothetical protein VK154_16395 [Chitinophagales bacterium]|nr:hypothetical protein [Chitinophagales bacterium]
MKKATILFVGVLMAMCVVAQKKDTIPDLSKGKYVITNMVEDSLSLKDEASYTLRALKNGAIIVRLKTSPKSVAAYRQAGRNDIADRIEADRFKQNQRMYEAFERNFFFCPVYFIYAHETQAFLDGKKYLFLNRDLVRDSTIEFAYGDNFVFCEYGSVESFSKFDDYSHPVAGPVNTVNLDKLNDKAMDKTPAGTSTSPATHSGIIMLDKELHQLHRPFPFVEGVYLDKFDAPVRTLDHDINRAYGRLVVNRDFKEKIKEEKKRMKAEKKKLPRYNPFKD